MNRRHKASLIAILGLGAFATAASMVKLSYIPNYGRAGDLMWDSRNLTIWTVQECNVGMVAGNLPCLKPLFRTLLSSTYGKGSHKTSQPQYDSYSAGTKERSAIKSYGQLASPKITDRNFFESNERAPHTLAHDGLGKSYMLTTIDATRGGGLGNRDAETTNSSGRSSPAGSTGGRSSTESVARLHHEHYHASGRGAHNLGNITVTTEVDVSEWVQARDRERGSARGVAQLQAKEMV